MLNFPSKRLKSKRLDVPPGLGGGGTAGFARGRQYPSGTGAGRDDCVTAKPAAWSAGSRETLPPRCSGQRLSGNSNNE